MTKISRQTKLTDYEGFVDKFVPKKTTDDCYTPKPVYDEVLRYVGEIADIKNRPIVRPFWPGGDFERYDYPDNCIVVDNPPFSIYAKIVRFYTAHGIDFFLFAPALTQPVMGAEVCYIVTMAEIVYENGAVVRTSFTTNLMPKRRIIVSGSLYKRLESVQVKNDKSMRMTVYPDNVLTVATMGKIAARGVDFEISAAECCYIRRTDNMPSDKTLFGAGFLLSERAAAERAAAERAAAERAAADKMFTIELSVREKAIVEILNKQSKLPSQSAPNPDTVCVGDFVNSTNRL